MRKILFLAVLLLGLMPFVEKGSWHFSTGTAIAQTMGEENDSDDDWGWGEDDEDYDFGDDDDDIDWGDISDEELEDFLDDVGFFDDFDDSFSDDFGDWLDDSDWFADDDWTFLDELEYYSYMNPDDGIDWHTLEGVTVTAVRNSDNPDNFDWSWLLNEMLYGDDPDIVGYNPDPPPNGEPPPEDPDKPKPKYAKANMKLYMKSQRSEKSCVPATFSYLNSQGCNGNKTEQDFIDQYESTHSGTNVATDGIPSNQISQYVANNFTYTNINYPSITAMIDAGNLILTTIKKYDDNNDIIYHSIVIIGYDTESDPDNRRLYYIDPEWGRQSHMKNDTWESSGGALYLYAITGCK